MRVGFGCVTLGSASGPSGRAGVQLVRAAVDAGVTLFDTADAYANGESERTLGRALTGRRSDVEIATKVGYRFDERSRPEAIARRVAGAVVQRYGPRSAKSGPARTDSGGYRDQDFSPRHLRAALDASLRRLGTDYIDVYQLHGPARADPELLAHLRDFVDRGLVRRVGIGAEGIGVASEWLEAPSDTDGPDLDVLQIPFGPLDPQAASQLLPKAARRGVEVWARGVFGGGVMGAAISGSDLPTPADRIRVVALQKIADDLGLDIFELAVAFVRSYAEVSTVLFGVSSRAHLQHNLELVRSTGPLSGPVLDRIRAAMEPSEQDDRT